MYKKSNNQNPCVSVTYPWNGYVRLTNYTEITINHYRISSFSVPLSENNYYSSLTWLCFSLFLREISRSILVSVELESNFSSTRMWVFLTWWYHSFSTQTYVHTSAEKQYHYNWWGNTETMTERLIWVQRYSRGTGKLKTSNYAQTIAIFMSFTLIVNLFR